MRRRYGVGRGVVCPAERGERDREESDRGADRWVGRGVASEQLRGAARHSIADERTGVKFDAPGTNRTAASVLYTPGHLLPAFTTDERRRRKAAICTDRLCFRVRVYRPWWAGTYAQ